MIRVLRHTLDRACEELGGTVRMSAFQDMHRFLGFSITRHNIDTGVPERNGKLVALRMTSKIEEMHANHEVMISKYNKLRRTCHTSLPENPIRDDAELTVDYLHRASRWALCFPRFVHSPGSTASVGHVCCYMDNGVVILNKKQASHSWGTLGGSRGVVRRILWYHATAAIGQGTFSPHLSRKWSRVRQHKSNEKCYKKHMGG